VYLEGSFQVPLWLDSLHVVLCSLATSVIWLRQDPGSITAHLEHSMTPHFPSNTGHTALAQMPCPGWPVSPILLS
jgi:hypothetical protein